MIDSGNERGLVERVWTLLAQHPAGFVSDFDGTLSPIVPHPDAARPLPQAVEALEKLVGYLALVAIVTGRRAEDVAQRLPVSGIVIVGNHGAEWLEDGRLRIAAEAEPWIPHVVAAAQALRQRLPDFLVEDKLVTLTVHLRNVDDPAKRERAQAVVAEVAATCGLVVKPGREVWELRPPIPLDKGSAVEALVVARALRSIVFAGDDVTDLDAMRRLRRLRERGRVRALLIGVWSAEAPAALGEEADVLVEGVEALAALLASVAERIANR